jgi:uncharacterized membrane protein
MPEITYPRDSDAESVTGTGQSDGRFYSRQEQQKKKGGSLGSIVAGGALAVYGASRKSLSGTALAAIGGWLALHGIRRATAPEGHSRIRKITA